jgi:hypothetical protein
MECVKWCVCHRRSERKTGRDSRPACGDPRGSRCAGGGKSAFETVIAVYDPGFAPATPPKRTIADRSTAAKRVTDLLKGKDVRGGVLVTLRDAEAPLRATDIAQRFAAREGIDASGSGLSAQPPDLKQAWVLPANALAFTGTA